MFRSINPNITMTKETLRRDRVQQRAIDDMLIALENEMDDLLDKAYQE